MFSVKNTSSYRNFFSLMIFLRLCVNFRLTNSGNSSLLYPLNYFRLRIGKKYYDSIFAIINQTKSGSENFRSFSVFPLHKNFQKAIIRASK